uniref:Uncharacterized protein n=1 Tax=Romanomermis culicivorax TaxID=13658 RepID=A0A915IAA1_ROMCU
MLFYSVFGQSERSGKTEHNLVMPRAFLASYASHLKNWQQFYKVEQRRFYPRFLRLKPATIGDYRRQKS